MGPVIFVVEWRRRCWAWNHTRYYLKLGYAERRFKQLQARETHDHLALRAFVGSGTWETLCVLPDGGAR
jgi:hypothetical protein